MSSRFVPLLAACLVLPGACRSAPPQRPRAADYPGVLRSPAALERDVLLRQHVTARWGEEEERGFDAVLQKHGGALTVLGLSPAGSLGFSVVQRADAIELTNHMPEDFPFEPRFILLDVQRAFYPWLPGPSGPRADGEHAAEVDGERVVETWSAGRLVERIFTRLSGEPAGEIRIRFHWERADLGVPSRTVLDNGWFGYRLTIETLEETSLEPADEEHA